MPQEAGLNRVVWDLRHQGPHARTMGAAAADDGGGFGFPARGPLVLPGKYTVRLTAGGKTLAFSILVDGHRPGSEAEVKAIDRIAEAIAAAE